MCYEVSNTVEPAASPVTYCLFSASILRGSIHGTPASRWPSCPNLFAPHEYTCPLLERARVWLSAAVTKVIGTGYRAVIRVGSGNESSLPCPRRPPLPCPAENRQLVSYDKYRSY